MLSQEGKMYDVEYYESSSGNIPFKDFLLSIQKNGKRNVADVKHFINMLKEYGPEINQNFKKRN